MHMFHRKRPTLRLRYTIIFKYESCINSFKLKSLKDFLCINFKTENKKHKKVALFLLLKITKGYSGESFLM